MKTVKARDTQVVPVLSKAEAEAVIKLVNNQERVTKVVLSAAKKIQAEING